MCVYIDIYICVWRGPRNNESTYRRDQLLQMPGAHACGMGFHVHVVQIEFLASDEANVRQQKETVTQMQSIKPPIPPPAKAVGIARTGSLARSLAASCIFARVRRLSPTQSQFEKASWHGMAQSIGVKQAGRQ